MSDRATSAHNWLRDSSLQIISAVIGSSLLVTAITTLASEINQPNVSLNVIPHYRTQSANVNEPEVEYYEIIVNNNGKRQATNMTLSAYFNGSILNPTLFFSGEALSVPAIEPISPPQNPQIKGSLVRWDIPRLASGAMMIFNVWTSTNDSATRFDPYYVTAIFDEGSKTYPVFGTADIELGRFPNILAGMEEAQTTQRILVTSIILCAIFFTIAIKYKKIKEIINERKEGRKWNEIKFDLFLALPITMLSSILIFYICEEIPLTALLHYLIMPPLDVTDGPPVDKIVTYKTGNYTQGDLLLSAGIFWGLSFSARSLLSYLIAKLLIPKFHEEFKEKPINTRYLGISSILIMGAPLTSTVMLFFSKSTYSIPPVYLFFLFLVIDMIRMSVLVIVIPKISIKTNKLFNYGLNALSIVTGLLHLLLFVTLLRTQLITPEPISGFLGPLIGICLIGGILQLLQIPLMKFREERNSRSRRLAAALFSVVLIGVWIWLLHHITSFEQEILSIGSPVITGSPIILTGIIVIVLNIAYIGLARVIDTRKIKRVKLKSWLDLLKTSNTGNVSSSKPCYPVELPIPVTVQLEYDDSNGKVSPEEKTKIIENKTITFHNGESKVDDNWTSPAIDKEGKLQI